jgi:hypothetical protein
MIIRRDVMMHLPPSAQAMAAAAYARYTASPQSVTSSLSNNPSPHITTQTIEKLAVSAGMGANSMNMNIGSSPISQSINMTMTAQSQNQGYTLNPLQQREQMQRETWERERRNLLKKASNSQGDSVERLLANYLAV